ncbi:protein of unknown function [Tepidibacter aestuarii]|nr:protein of unknown function [Tepidibacter aestuarii]
MMKCMKKGFKVVYSQNKSLLIKIVEVIYEYRRIFKFKS